MCLCVCVCVWTYTCMHALWVYGYMCAMAHIWSHKTVPSCWVRVSLVSTALYVSGYDPQSVLLLLCWGYRCITAHLTVYMGSGHWIWTVRLAWQVLLPQTTSLPSICNILMLEHIWGLKAHSAVILFLQKGHPYSNKATPPLYCHSPWAYGTDYI